MLTRLLGLILTLGLAAACGKQVVPTPAGPGDETQRRQAGVYTAVLRYHLTHADRHDWSTVYVLDHAVTNAADPQRPVTGDRGTAIDRRVREAVVDRLENVAPVRFVPERGEVAGGDQGCQLKRKDAILITLTPVPSKGDKLKIGLNGWQGCLAGSWQTYVVVADGDGWKVTGTTGPATIS